MSYKFSCRYITDDLIQQVSQLLAPDLYPKFNKTGITYYGNRQGKRILEIVERSKQTIEFNVPVNVCEGVQVLTKKEAKDKKMGTCHWIYVGSNNNSIINLINEAKYVYDQKTT